jgi:hypothetical protein
MNRLKLLTVTSVLAWLMGCVAAETFPEARGNPNFSQAAFESGEFRLGPARPGSMGALKAWRYVTNRDPLPANTSLPDAVLNALVAKPNGNDASYYWLAWTAEKMGLYTAAYEYYRLSKLLFDFNRIPDADENFWETATRDADITYYSPCGEKHRGDPFARGANVYCPDNMYRLLNQALARMEAKIASDL